MARPLVIVESPAKAKTISRFLGNAFDVRASVGHVADLPSKGLAVDVENGFKPTYELTERVLRKQSLAIQIFVRSWSQHRPAVAAFVDTMHDAPAEDIEHAARVLSRYLATTPLEGLTSEDVVAALLNRPVS